MKNALQEGIDIEKMLSPETKVERLILEDSAFQKGLNWGTPRFGHPEGKVIFHIQEVLENVDKLDITEHQRQQLRLIAYTHDTFKYLEIKGFPRDWSKHHGVFARHFTEKFSEEQSLLDIIEFHDEAYYSWRHTHIHRDPESGQSRLDNLLQRVGSNIQLYYLFFKCDTRTGDKNQAPLKWFEKNIKNIEIADF